MTYTVSGGALNSTQLNSTQLLGVHFLITFAAGRIVQPQCTAIKKTCVHTVKALHGCKIFMFEVRAHDPI